VRPRRGRTRQPPDDRDRGPNAQASEGGGDHLRHGAPLCPKTTVVDGDYDDLAEVNRRHRSLRQYHDRRRPMTPASLALASWRHGSRNWSFAMRERSFRSEVTIKSLAKTLASSVVGRAGVIRSFEPEMSAGSGGRWRRAPPISRNRKSRA
jgi:hypothetical protein